MRLVAATAHGGQRSADASADLAIHLQAAILAAEEMDEARTVAEALCAPATLS